MCINTGFAEAGLEDREPQQGTETLLPPISLVRVLSTIRRQRTPVGDGNSLSSPLNLAKDYQKIENPSRGRKRGFPQQLPPYPPLEDREPQQGTETKILPIIAHLLHIIRRQRTPVGDGNSANSFNAFSLYSLEDREPQQGTETRYAN